MQKIILIAALALTSAAAHADDNRSLSTAPSDAPAAIQTKPGQAQSDAPLAAPTKPADAPRYNAPPAPPPATASTAHPERRYDDRGYFDDAGYHPFPRRYANADRHTDADRHASTDRYANANRYANFDRYAKRPHGYAGRPHHHARWTARRIMAQLRRYGVYW
jgi:hypothetical protein